MGMVIKQYEIFLINLDPTVGAEIKKSRPCVVISPDEMNQNIRTISIAPMTTKQHPYPTRVQISFQKKRGQIVLDQIHTIDKSRILRRLGVLDPSHIVHVKQIIKEMLVD